MEFEREHLCVLPEMERASKQITVSGLRQRLWDSFFSLFLKSQVSTLPFGCFCFFFITEKKKVGGGRVSGWVGGEGEASWCGGGGGGDGS